MGDIPTVKGKEGGDRYEREKLSWRGNEEVNLSENK